MIIRVFRSTPRPGGEARYERMIREESTDLVRSQKGLIALYTGARLEPGNELVMVSIWEDEASVAAFVGPEWHSAVVLPGEAELVLQSEVANFQSWQPRDEAAEANGNGAAGECGPAGGDRVGEGRLPPA